MVHTCENLIRQKIVEETGFLNTSKAIQICNFYDFDPETCVPTYPALSDVGYNRNINHRV